MVEVIEASTEEHYRQARRLIGEYTRFLGLDLEFQGLSKELDGLAEMYGPPRGAMLLLREGQDWVGCVGLRPLPDGNAEMKRMFIQPAFQGRGLGGLLMEAFIAKARALGYPAIRLDSVTSLTRAQALYRKYGFRDIPPYRYNPLPEAVFMELRLREARP